MRTTPQAHLHLPRCSHVTNVTSDTREVTQGHIEDTDRVVRVSGYKFKPFQGRKVEPQL